MGQPSSRARRVRLVELALADSGRNLRMVRLDRLYLPPSTSSPIATGSMDARSTRATAISRYGNLCLKRSAGTTGAEHIWQLTMSLSVDIDNTTCLFAVRIDNINAQFRAVIGENVCVPIGHLPKLSRTDGRINGSRCLVLTTQW